MMESSRRLAVPLTAEAFPAFAGDFDRQMILKAKDTVMMGNSLRAAAGGVELER